MSKTPKKIEMTDLSTSRNKKKSISITKNRTSLLNLGKRAADSTIGYISSFDENGAPI